MKKINKITRRDILLLSAAMGGYPAITAGNARSQQSSPEPQEYTNIIEDMAGSGSESDPYVITDITELQAIEGDIEAHYILGNDIDASVTENWNDGNGFEPIGEVRRYDADMFTGTLDGNGYIIDKLIINRENENNVGLFSVCLGTIKNIGLDNADITGYRHVGGIIGDDRASLIKNIYVDGTIQGYYDVGGIVGKGKGIIRDSETHGLITGDNFVGGLVGIDTGSGISNISIELSHSTANVVANAYSGGLIGASNGDISNAYSTGDVTSTSANSGGLVGRSSGSITESCATGDVSGDSRVGGLVGVVLEGTTITNTYSTGNVEGNDEVGGLVGYSLNGSRDSEVYINKSYTTSTVDSEGSNSGAVFGHIGSGMYFYWEYLYGSEELSSQSEFTGNPNEDIDYSNNMLQIEEIQGDSAAEEMEGLDFVSVWDTVEDDYPILRDLSIPDEVGDEEPITTEMTGKVVDQHDNPVSSVPLYVASTQQLYLGNELIDQYPDIFPPNPEDKLTVTARTETNEDGEYRVNSIPHGNYFVLAVPEPGQDPSERNYNPRLREKIIIHDEPKSVDIVLPSNRPLSSLSSKVEAITTESQSEIDTTTDLAAKKFVGLSKIGQSELESSIYDYFSISDAMFDDDSEQTLDDRAARTNVELLEDGVRDRILDYASDMTPSMEAILGDASEEFLDEEWVQNYENQSPTELVEIGYRKMPFYIDSEKRLNINWEFYKKEVETKVPSENFSVAEARSILDDVYNQIENKNYGIPGVVIAPNGESYKFDQTETYANVYDTYEDLADFADTGQTLASGGKVVGGMIMLAPGGQAVGGSMIALSGKTYKAAKTTESLSTASMGLAGVFTQYYWPHDLNEISAVPESTTEWLASAVEEGLSETQVELTDVDLNLSELSDWRDPANFTVPYIGANQPKDPPSYWPFQDTAVETAQITVQNLSDEPVEVRITMHDQFGDGNNTSIEGTMVPPPDEDPLEIGATGARSMPIDYSVNFDKFFNERVMSIGVWVNGVRRDFETVVFEVRHSVDLFSLSTADQSADETLSTEEIDERRAGTSRIMDAKVSPEEPAFETVHSPADTTEAITYYLSTGGNVGLQVIDTDGNVSGYDPESDTVLTDIPESTVIGPNATPQRVNITKDTASEYTIRAVGYRFESGSNLSVITDVIETPTREAILSVNQTEIQVMLTPNIDATHRLSLSEAGGQKGISNVEITSEKFHDSEDAELENFQVSIKEATVDIAAGETTDTTLVFESSDGFRFPNAPKSTRFDGNVTINTTNAGNLELSVSGIGIQTDVDNARLIRADDSVAGIQMTESPTEELDVELPESMSLVSAYDITISGKGNVSIRLPDSLGGDNVRPLRIVGNEYEEVTLSSGNETGTVSLSDGDFYLVIVENKSTDHESGVDQEIFNAVDQSGDGDVSLSELQDAVDDWSTDQEINGVEASLDDLRAIVDWWAS